MANFDTVTKIITGDITGGGEISSTAGTLAKAVSDYLDTIDSTKLVSMTTSFQPTLTNGKKAVVVVIVTDANLYHPLS
tara:strand:- start:286 stop:519 length:234 start_codon:yes stop_codon:yes gene_type:complete